MIAALPVWFEVPVSVFAGIGCVAGSVLTIINLDLAVDRLRQAHKQLKARLTR